MTKFTTIAILATAGVLLTPFGSHAATIDESLAETAVQIEIDSTDEAKSLIYFAEAERDEAVLAAVSRADGLIPVRDNNGDLYFNHLVSDDELPTVDFDLDVVDSYQFEYNGRVYTNKVVED